MNLICQQFLCFILGELNWDELLWAYRWRLAKSDQMISSNSPNVCYKYSARKYQVWRHCLLIFSSLQPQASYSHQLTWCIIKSSPQGSQGGIIILDPKHNGPISRMKGTGQMIYLNLFYFLNPISVHLLLTSSCPFMQFCYIFFCLF